MLPKKPDNSASAAVKTAAKKQNTTDHINHPLVAQSNGGCFFELTKKDIATNEPMNISVASRFPIFISDDA